ncbi:ABC transporter permease [Convivina intestini]|uniref:ABC-2 type transport system permease protein n=1 Tax=Convivina intestini TaxID=1505726 RepID=A0A2U1D3W8_9LACO|nr:ABC transporter permease [Convivina intestini]PVY82367.1 ABC-2 type transport system permease protein [Convivina intestini]CAH1854558.1 hypothetical protein R078131_00981 [Convivina intestini]CAH1857368.1 hypothetical protein R077811_01476 [Convivina intestini]SDC15048.1 ABC-2 type transport system permease protein [Leuconostocaceae bacterium R-53105]
MGLTKLFWQRFATAQQRNIKYLRLLFNEHFVLFLLIAFGGLVLGYRSLLMVPASSDFWQNPWWKFAILAWLVIGLQLGHLVTYFRPADRLFLLGQDHFLMSRYLKQALGISAGFASVWQLIFFASVWPILTAVGFHQIVSLLLVLLFTVMYKIFLLVIERYQLLTTAKQVANDIILKILIPIIILASLFWLPSLVGLGIVLVVVFLVVIVARQLNAQAGQVSAALAWPLAIQQAQSHEQAVLHFYALFAEVPQQAKSIKRRAYLDSVIVWLTPKGAGIQRLYLTQLIRNNEILPLILRLWLVAIIILINVHSAPSWLIAAIAAMTVYLVNFQIYPLFLQTRQVLWTQLVPIGLVDQKKLFNRLLLGFSLLSIVMILAATVTTWSALLAGLAGAILMTIFCYYFYIPRLLKKGQ